LKISKGSANELKTQLLLAGRLNELSTHELYELNMEINTLLAMIQSMINARLKMN
jgi:four helix bundle protein